MPVSRNAHQLQFAATPPVRTKLVTRFGVSVLNVVATIETPISHHGAARPDVKNSAVLDPARRASTIAGMNETTIETATMTQSSDVRRIRDGGRRRTDDGREPSGCLCRGHERPEAERHRSPPAASRPSRRELQRQHLERLELDPLRLLPDEPPRNHATRRHGERVPRVPRT